MRKIKNIVAIATVAVMAFSMAGCKMIEKTPAAIQKTVLAKVGNEKITMADVNSELKSDIDYLIQTYGKDYENSMDDTMKEKLKSARKSVLEQLVNDKVLITKGTELGYVLSGDELNADIEKERQNFVEAYGGEDKLQEAIKYYGMDDEEISIGDYVLTGGELPAMVLVDAVSRYVDGVINKESVEEESFSNGLLEYPQYTRPEIFLNKQVPEVLKSRKS